MSSRNPDHFQSIRKPGSKPTFELIRRYTWGSNENTYGKMPYSYHLYFNQWAETDLRAMIRRDRNHPSVIMYSIGNEIPNQRTPDGVQIAKKLMEICRNHRPEYYLRKSYWSDEPVVRIAVETGKSPASDWHPRKVVSHWNHKWSGNYLLPIYVYSNCDEVGCDLL